MNAELPISISLTRNELVCLIKWHQREANGVSRRLGKATMQLLSGGRPSKRDLTLLNNHAVKIAEAHLLRAKGLISILKTGSES